MEKILLIGAGALARDIIDAFGAERFAAAYVDPEFSQTSVIAGVPVCTDWREAVKLAPHYILAIASPTHRAQARARADELGLRPAPALATHLAYVAKSAKLDPGCLVGHFSTIGPEAHLEEHVLVMHNNVVGHDVLVGQCAVLCAGVMVGGYARIGARTFVGTNAVIGPHVNIGNESWVAAGAACLRDAPAGSRLVGNPARQAPYRGRSRAG